MAVLDIRTYPDEVLKKKAQDVPEVDAGIKQLIEDMKQTMYAASGVGLAAPQVGVSKRVIVVDTGPMEDEEGGHTAALVNPEIIKAEGAVEFEEGCLSLPGFTTKVRRHAQITVKALDGEGNEVEVEADGIFAIALQHEMDHLDGTLLLDRASAIKREFYKKRVKKQMAKA